MGVLRHRYSRLARTLLASSGLVLVPLVLGIASAQGGTVAVSTVTIQVIGEGTVTSNPAGVECGSGRIDCHIAFSGSGGVTLTPNAEGDWAFDTWSDCPTSPVVGTCIVPIDGNAYIVTAAFRGPPTTASTLSTTFTGSGNVSGGGIDCGASPSGVDCTWTVLTGSTATVLQKPAPENVFTGWGGACSGTAVACTVELSGDRTVSAAWASSNGVLLDVSVSGTGVVTGGGINCPPACAATQAVNATVLLTATPASVNTFTGWGGACSGSTPTCAVLMSEARSVTATFAPVVQLSVTVSGEGNVAGGGGAINCGSNGTSCAAGFAVDTTVTLTATPTTGASFTGWSGACGGASTTCTIVLAESRSVTATFGRGTAPLTVQVSGPGSVTGGGVSCGGGATTCSANQPLNSSVTLTATASSGATFSGWSGACTGSGPTCTLSMTGPKSVSATFAAVATPNPGARLTVTVTGPGTVSGSGIDCGNGKTGCTATPTLSSKVTLTAAPSPGTSFVGWSGDCSGSSTACSFTMSAARNVGATFAGEAPARTVSVLTALAKPRVRRVAGAFQVTLRFQTTKDGVVLARALRSRRVVASVSRRVVAGPVQLSLTVRKPGTYVFRVGLESATIRWRTCVGRCGN